MVRAGLIASHHLSAARALQNSDGGTIGEHLVTVGAVSDEALTEFYRSRLMVPQINPNTLARLPSAVVAVLPGDMAVEFRAVPVSLDKDGNLTVAMSDPSDRHAVDEIAFFTGKYVVRAVATQMQIAWCLAQYYGHVTELGERLLQPVADDAPPMPAPAKPATPAAAPGAAPVTRARGDTSKVQAARHRVLAPVTTPPPVGPRPGPDALTRGNGQGQVPAPGESVPAALAAQASGPVIEMQVDDPSGPVRAPLAPVAPPPPPPPPEPPKPEPTVDSATPSIIVSPEATMPKRKRPALPDPPELAARSGEMESHESRSIPIPSTTIEVFLEEDPPPPPPPPVPRKNVPAVVIEDEDGAAPARPVSDDDTRADEPALIHDTEAMPAVIHDAAGAPGTDGEDDDDGTDSHPILLDRPRRPESLAGIKVPPVEADEEEIDPGEPIVERPEVEPPPREEPSAPILLVALKPKAPGGRKAKRTQIGIGTFGALGPIPTVPASAPATPTLADDRDAVPAMVAEDDEAKTRRVESRPPPSAGIDDGWGPPGTTIPPPFIGAVVPADDPASGRIPVPGMEGDSQPLVISQPKEESVPRPRALTGSAEQAQTARALEAAAIKLVETLRAFDQATSRDHVIAMLVDFVSETHHRVAFLAAKPGELTAFMQNPAPAGPQAHVSLSAPSVFQDVVGTRLPYRGPISDPVTRELVRTLFGSTTDEMMAVPLAVRERVVGVIYADGRQRLASEEHVTVAARAAGMALERLLKAKKS
jgi:hypothetical protein